MKIKYIQLLFFLLIYSLSHAQNAPQQLLEAGKKALATQQYQAALVEFQSAAMKAQEPAIKLNAQLLISETAALLKDSEGSQEAMQKALQILEKDLKNDCQYLKKVNLKYGEQLYQQADYSKAIQVGQAGLDCLLNKAMNSMEDTLLIADYYYNLGIYYSLTNDLDKSLSYSLNALDWHRRMDNREALSDIYHNLGNLFYKNGRYKEALDFILQGRDIQATIVGGDALDKYFINCNAHVASTYRLLGKPDSAFVYINKSISIHRKNPYREDETYKVFAQLYLEKGDLKEAESYARQSLTAARKAHGEFHPVFSQACLLLTDIYLKQGETDKAMQAVQTAIKALDMNFDATNIKAQADVNHCSDLNVLLDALQLKSKLWQRLKDPKSALAELQTAITVINKIHQGFSADGSKLFLFQRALPIYENAIDLILQNSDYKDIEQALQVVERNKSMLLQDALQDDAAKSFGMIPDSLIQKESALHRSIAQAEKTLFESERSKDMAQQSRSQEEILLLKRELDKLQATFETAYPEYHNLRFNTSSVSSEKLKERLEPNTLLLEYFVGDSVAYVFSLSKEHGQKVTKIEDLDNLNWHIRKLRKALTDVQFITKEKEQSLAQFKASASALYDLLMAEHIHEGTQRLQIIPDANLNHIPFEVLLTEKTTETDFQRLPYLILKYSVNYQYAASLMLRPRMKVGRNANRVLAFGPSYKVPDSLKNNIKTERERQIRGSLDDLPGAVSEVDMLKDIFRGDFIYASAANEAAFKKMAQSEQYSVLHLAMHGLVNTQHPKYSSLVFTKTADAENDDLLYAYELSLLALKADLVVLSACETGYGKYQRGEGVMSIGRGFMFAGVPALGMTLWPLNDQAGAKLMMDFYNNLCADMPKDMALREAKLSYLRENPGIAAHPFFWAAIVTLGDEAPIEMARRTLLERYWYWFALGALPILLLLGWVLFRRKRK